MDSIGLDINDAGWVVGGGCDAVRGDNSVLWIPGVGPLRFDEWAHMPFPTFGIGAINNSDQMVTAGVYSDGNLRLLFWDPVDGYQWLPDVTVDGNPGVLVLYDLNDLGWVIGGVDAVGYQGIGFVWDRQRGVRLIRDMMDPCAQPPYQTATYVGNVNNHGWMTSADDAFQNLSVLIPYIPGDLDEDGDCDLQDLANLLSNFARTGDATYVNGDLDCDADVDLQDLGILLGNFGETLP